MTETNSWADQWLKAQQQFVSAWSDMAKQGTEQSPAGQANMWADSFDLWRKACGGPDQPEAQQALNKCFDMGKGYFTMAEQIGKSIAAGANPAEAVTQWIEQLKESMQQSSCQWGTGGSPDVNGFMKQWFTPANSWQQMASAMAPLQQSAWQMPGMNTSVFNMGETIDPMGKILSSPGIGYFREPQEKQQKGIQLAIDYQQSNFKFNQAFLQVSTASLQEFQQQLMSLEGGKTPRTLRELYDLWVNISEEHYAEFAMSEEYQALYGDLVNRLMAYKKYYNEMTEDLLKMMNLPIRSEVDTMQVRLQQLRRENCELKKEIGEIKLMVKKINTAPVAPATRPKKASFVKKAAVSNKVAGAKKTPGSKKTTATKKLSAEKKARTTNLKTGAGS